MLLVYVFEVEDRAADGWASQIAVLGDSASTANRALRDAGLHKRQIQNQGRAVTTAPLQDERFATLGEGRFMRRRLNDSGWTAWALVPAGEPLNWRLDPNAPTTR